MSPCLCEVILAGLCLRRVYRILLLFILFISVIEFKIINNTDKTFILKECQPQSGQWVIPLPNQVIPRTSIEGKVSKLHTRYIHTHTGNKDYSVNNYNCNNNIRNLIWDRW